MAVYLQSEDRNLRSATDYRVLGTYESGLWSYRVLRIPSKQGQGLLVLAEQPVDPVTAPELVLRPKRTFKRLSVGLVITRRSQVRKAKDYLLHPPTFCNLSRWHLPPTAFHFM